jgi:hypothetical protein
MKEDFGKLLGVFSIPKSRKQKLYVFVRHHARMAAVPLAPRGRSTITLFTARCNGFVVVGRSIAFDRAWFCSKEV